MGRIKVVRRFGLGNLLGVGVLTAAAYGAAPLVMPASASASASTTSVATSPGLAAGITQDFDSLSDSQLTSTMNAIAAAGTTWVRIGVAWPVAEWNEGSFNWGPSDRVAQAALGAGLKIDFVVNGSGQDVPGGASNVPPWAQTCSGGCPSASAFGSFASAVAGHYSPMGIHTYEIWNEPNLASNWGPQASGTQYAALLIQAYKAVKAVDPQSFIVSGGLSPAGNDGTDVSPQTFLTEMYAAGAAGHMDAVGTHPYCFPADPTDSSSASWNFFYNLPTWIHQVMVDNGDGSKSVWMTEFGAPTSGSGAVTYAQQAQMITDAFNQAKQWSWAGPLFVFDWQDSSDSFGLIDSSGNAKPSLSAFESEASALNSSRTSTSGTSGTGVSSGPVTSSSLSAPANFKVAVRGSTVFLSWATPSGAQGANVYRDGTKIASTSTATSFWDADVPTGSHTYYVAAFNSSGQGTPSNSVTVKVGRSGSMFLHSGVIHVVG